MKLEKRRASQDWLRRTSCVCSANLLLAAATTHPVPSGWKTRDRKRHRVLFWTLKSSGLDDYTDNDWLFNTGLSSGNTGGNDPPALRPLVYKLTVDKTTVPQKSPIPRDRQLRCTRAAAMPAGSPAEPDGFRPETQSEGWAADVTDRLLRPTLERLTLSWDMWSSEINVQLIGSPHSPRYMLGRVNRVQSLLLLCAFCDW